MVCLRGIRPNTAHAYHRKENIMKNSKTRTVLFCLWVIIAMLAVQSAVTMIGLLPKSYQLLSEADGVSSVYREKYNDYIQNTPILTILQFVSEIVSIVAAAVWYYLGYVKKDKENGTYRPFGMKFKGYKSICFILCGTLACWGFASVLQQIVSMLMPATASAVNDLLNATLGGYEVLGIITLVLLAPIFEELAVRGIILQRSKRAFGVAGCMIISAVMFGIFHMNPIQAIYVLPLGLFWGYVGYRFNTVIPCIFCHILNNLLGIIMPSYINPVIIFIVFGAAAALIGVRLDAGSDTAKGE